MEVMEPELAPLHSRIRVVETHPARSKRLHFSPFQHETHLEFFENLDPEKVDQILKDLEAKDNG